MISSNPITPGKALFKFENNEKAAAFNSKLLRSMDMNFEKAINAEEKQRTVDFRGSEEGNFCLKFLARVVLAPGNIASFVRHCPPALPG